MTREKALELIGSAAEELAAIDRAKEYAMWRPGAAAGLSAGLAGTEPFAPFMAMWLFTGDGAGQVVGARFGEWVVDRLVSGARPVEILAELAEEAQRNEAHYLEVSPVLGMRLEQGLTLQEGATLVAAADAPLWWRNGLVGPWLLPLGSIADDTAFLCQRYRVSPAFERRTSTQTAPAAEGVTLPPQAERNAVRARVRLACLLAGTGAVEMPISAIEPDGTSPFLAGRGNQMARPSQARPLVAMPVDGAIAQECFESLASFSGADSLARAIDRLGRARLSLSEVDRALDLGMAAEIALMHDHGTSNTEIAHKISGRAAWLTGSDPKERGEIFSRMKRLYEARSKAVHSGALSSKSKIDLDNSDRLVTQALRAILQRGSFPDWANLTLGGAG